MLSNFKLQLTPTRSQMLHGAGNGGQEPHENAAGEDEGTVRRYGSVLNLPPTIKRLFQQYNHVSDWLPQLNNARYFYYEKKRLERGGSSQGATRGKATTCRTTEDK